MIAYGILNTHAHYDHIRAISKIKNEFSIPFFLHSKDKKLLNTANLYGKLFEESEIIRIPSVDYYFDQIKIQDYIDHFSITVFYTPGHTWGSICLQIEDCLFTGDTLLRGKIGRIDLPGGNGKALKESLKILSKFPKYISIYPGHGEPSTIGDELKFNKNLIDLLI